MRRVEGECERKGDDMTENKADPMRIPLSDHDEIGRKIIGQPWAIQSAIVTIAAHCTMLVDGHPTGDVADLAGCISECCAELATALAAPQPAAPLDEAARFYIDHGMIHDLETGKHVVTDGEWPFEDDLPRVLVLLNGLAIPQERGVDRAAIIEECALRAQKIADSYRENGSRTTLTVVIEGIVEAIRALGKETGR